MKIRDLLDTVGDRALPVARERDTLEEVLQKMISHPHTRLIYVLNDEGRCRGTISLGILIRHLFPHGFEPAVHARFLIPMITSVTAEDIMNRELIHAMEDDSLEKVVKRMIKAGVKEIAVLDSEKRLIGDLTMLDLLKYFHLPR